jgi:hypothetical protein
VSSPCAVVPTAHLCKHACEQAWSRQRASIHPPAGREENWDCRRPAPSSWACRSHNALCKHASIRHGSVRQGLRPTGSHRSGQQVSLSPLARCRETVAETVARTPPHTGDSGGTPTANRSVAPLPRSIRHDGRASPCRPPATKQRPPGPSAGLWAVGKHPRL